MLDDELAKWLEGFRPVWDVEVPYGWERLDSLPLNRPVDLLYPNGEIDTTWRVSNPAMYMDPPMAWRPAFPDDDHSGHS